MKELFELIANDNKWTFEYARQDYQNLVEIDNLETIGLFLDPIITDSKFSVSGNETKTFSGKFMLLLNSDVDEDYKDKYARYIKPLMESALQIIKDFMACTDFQCNTFRTIEVINLFDQNYDGILVTYSYTLIE